MPGSTNPGAHDLITEEEFDRLLDDMQAAKSAATKSPAAVSEQVCMVDLPASTTAQELGPLRESLQQCLADEREVELSAASVESIDGVALQLLALFANERQQQGRAVTIATPTAVFAEAVTRLGLSALLPIGERSQSL